MSSETTKKSTTMSGETADETTGEKHYVCDDHDLWADETAFFEAGQQKVMVFRDLDEEIHAYDATCPHQDRDLEETGKRECACGPHDDETTLTCSAHSWEFDLESGEGLNPVGTHMIEYDAGIEGDQVYVVVPEGG